ncbi:hypothetical protein DFH09DRAFT_1086953 [Mycena vulgaris]|nr:hypothetical protein DFH09DRAFT_1086953 [Mycena vulgaris]
MSRLERGLSADVSEIPITLSCGGRNAREFTCTPDGVGGDLREFLQNFRHLDTGHSSIPTAETQVRAKRDSDVRASRGGEQRSDHPSDHASTVTALSASLRQACERNEILGVLRSPSGGAVKAENGGVAGYNVIGHHRARWKFIVCIKIDLRSRADGGAIFEDRHPGAGEILQGEEYRRARLLEYEGADQDEKEVDLHLIVWDRDHNPGQEPYFMLRADGTLIPCKMLESSESKTADAKLNRSVLRGDDLEAAHRV